MKGGWDSRWLRRRRLRHHWAVRWSRPWARGSPVTYVFLLRSHPQTPNTPCCAACCLMPQCGVKRGDLLVGLGSTMVAYTPLADTLKVLADRAKRPLTGECACALWVPCACVTRCGATFATATFVRINAAVSPGAVRGVRLLADAAVCRVLCLSPGCVGRSRRFSGDALWRDVAKAGHAVLVE